MDLDGILNTVNSTSKVYKITSREDLGGDIVINCPYHKQGQERTGSFSILKSEKVTTGGVLPAGTGHCFACGVTKTLPQFIKDVTGEESVEQVEEWLKRTFQYSGEVQIPITSLLQPKEDKIDEIEYKHYRVDYHPFFERRHITRESVRTFELGIDNQHGYAVFPIKDKNGSCQMLFKRSLEGKRFYNTAGAKKENLLFGLNEVYKNLERLQHYNQIWVVESVIDAILLWQRGFVAVAMLQAIPTKQQIDLLNNVPFTEIIVGTDNDEAGRRGLQEMINKLDKTIHRVVYPTNDYKDIGDFKQEEQIYIEEVRRKNRRVLPLG